MMLAVTSDAHFPMRLVPAMIGRDKEVVDLVAYTKACRDRSTDRLRMGLIKLAADGSIQANTARLLEPGYLTGPRNGMWYMPREWIEAVFVEALREGVQIHIHTNGDQAVQLAIDAFDAAARKTPASDHRFSLQHCQLANRAQLRQMARLGLCANFFSNHTYYYGDLHATLTVGPDRAERMNPCRSAQDFGVPYTIHADAPVTPMNPLHVAWCAVNRSTMSGRLLGEYERISVIDALRAITLGSAYTLRLDHEIGSIECGKRADFAVLEDDPLELPSEKLKDVGVWGTVQGGRVFDAASI
jgi:predicted amidohydrolase YtcJ